MKAIRPLLFSCFLVFSINSGPAVADTWTVPADSPTIQGAVDLASPGDVIEIDCGTYADCTHPDPLNYLNCVIMKPGITLRGTGADPSCVVIDASGGRGILCSNLSSSVTIENLTIRNGSIIMGGPDPSNARIDADGGAGLSIDFADVVVRNCRFENNMADVGGAVLADHGTIQISECVFDGNTAFDYGGGIYGVGVNLERCHFLNNVSYTFGGAIHGIDSTIESCMLENNVAGFGGGISGGGIQVLNSSLHNNTASGPGNGGGIYVFSGNLWAFNTDFLGNSALEGESGYVVPGNLADLVCCDTDLATWSGEQPALDLTDCVVGQEDMSWGNLKALYR